MRRLSLFSAILLTISLSNFLYADILHVPDDFDDIQEAIDNCAEGDTVLVATGTYYVAPIQLGGDNIVLASEFLFSNDPDDITSTIIDVEGNGACVVISAGNIAKSTLIGFTLQNGEQDFGGGIDVRQGVEAEIRNCIVRENTANNGGAGIYISSESTCEIYNTTIEDNYSEGSGGGIHCLLDSDVYLYNCIIRGNSAEYAGGGLLSESEAAFTLYQCLIADNSAFLGGGAVIYGSTDNTFYNVTIANNESSDEYYAGGVVVRSSQVSHSQLEIYNSIVYGNSTLQATMEGHDEDYEVYFKVAYTNVEDGIEGIINIGDAYQFSYDFETNIHIDPAFTDPDEGNYTLTLDSPCIDAGDPASPFDPDGTIPDLGAFPFTHTSILEGYVTSAASDEPIAGATVSTQKLQQATTDSTGYWTINPASFGDYVVGVEAFGYNPDASDALEIEYDESYQLDFSLLQGEISASDTVLTAQVTQGDTTTMELEIANSGEGYLNWSMKMVPYTNPDYDHLELIESLAASDSTGNESLKGVTFDGEYFYVAGDDPERRGTDLKIYKLNENGSLVDEFLQPNPNNEYRGMQDLAWDGEHLIGAVDNTIYWFSTDGELSHEMEVDIGGVARIQAITVDPYNQLVFVGELISDIYIYDYDGELQSRLDRKSLRL